MSVNLETKINQPGPFKSAGERKIAEVLDKYGIPFKYESPVLVHDQQKKPRIWYPDFYLPTHGIYVEYYGLCGHPSYDSLRERKQQAYQGAGLQVISVDGSVPRHRLEGYVLNQIFGVQTRRFQAIKSTIYLLRTKTGPL
jgi:hypothetical protein